MPTLSQQVLVPPQLNNKAASSPRDERLDFWRALCLIDMLLVHLVYDGVNFGLIQRTVGEYTRFAAGGFVFVAGLSIGAIFLPRTFASGGRKKVYLSLWRRAFYILCVHWAATLSFVSLALIRGERIDVPNVFHLIRDILLFREGGDLLPLYVIVVAASPFMLELLRRRLWWVLGGASVLLFAWGQNHPWFLSSPIHEKFPVILWQMIFIAGMLFGIILPRYTKLSRAWKSGLMIAALGLSVLLWAGDFRSDFGWARPVLPLSFCKTPLSIGEALRYFGIIFTMVFATDLVWNRIAGSRIIAMINTMGRRSLAVYVAHVWIVGLLAMMAWKATQLGAWQMMLAIPGVAGMWLVAVGLEWQNSRAVPTAMSWRKRWLPIPLGALGGALAFCIVGSFTGISPEINAPTRLPAISGSTDQTRDFDDADVPDGAFFDPQDSADMMTA